jgi:DNA mismatch endonuclease (patch repair protein)
MTPKRLRKKLARGAQAAGKATHRGDFVSAEARSRIMKSVRRSDTTPEIVVRSLLRSMGLRFRVKNRDLPGSPDVANRKRKWAMFVNGCFWHGHKNCPKTKSDSASRVPVSNREFWFEKLRTNRQRDAKKSRQLRHLGYRVLIVWECELSTPDRLKSRLAHLRCFGMTKLRELV